MDADRLSLEQAHDMIRDAGDNINLSISNLEEQELRENEELAKAFALSASEPEDTEDEASRDTGLSEASEVDTSEAQHSVASIASTTTVESEQPRTETSVATDTDHSIADHSTTDHSTADPSTADRATEESDMSRSSSTKSSSVREVKIDDDEEQYVDVNSLPLLPPRPAPEPEKAQRKCWHPVMLDTNPPPIIEETTGDEEYPHKKTIRNLRKAIAEKKVTPTPETLIFFLCNKFAVSEERANKISV